MSRQSRSFARFLELSEVRGEGRVGIWGDWDVIPHREELAQASVSKDEATVGPHGSRRANGSARKRGPMINSDALLTMRDYISSRSLAASDATHSNSGNWCRNQVNCRLA